MPDANTSELDRHEREEEIQDQDWSARLERARGYVAMGDFDLSSIIAENYATKDYHKICALFANGEYYEAGRRIHKMLIEQVARELESDYD